MAVQDIRAKLSLDDAEFAAKLTANEKSVLKFSAAVAAIGAAATVAAVKTAEWQDKTGKLAQTAGVSSAAFSKLSVAAEKSNLSQEELAKSLAKISSASPEMATRLSKVGVSFQNASGQAKTSSEVFADVADKVAKAGTTAEKTSIAVRAFGEEGAKLVPMLAGGRKELEKLGAQAEKYGLVVSEQAAAAAAQFNDEMTETKMALTGVVSAIGESLIAWSNQGGVMGIVRDTLAGITQAWRGLSDETKNAIITVGAITAALVTLATAFITIKTIAPVIGKALTTMFGPVGIAIMATAAAIGFLTAGFAKYGHTLDTITTPATAALSVSWQNTKTALAGAWEALQSTSGALDKTAQSAEAVNRPISWLGTAVAWITKQFAIMAVSAAGSLERFAILVQGAVQHMRILKEMAVAAITLDKGKLAQLSADMSKIEADVQAKRLAAKQRTDMAIAELDKQSTLRYEDQAKKRVQTAEKAAEQIQRAFGQTSTQFSNPVITAFRDIELAAMKMRGAPADAIAAFERRTQALQASTTTAATQMSIGYAKVAEAAVNSVGPAIGAMAQLTDAMANATRYAAKVAARDLEVMSIRAQRAYEAQKAAMDAQHEKEVESINSVYDAKISAVTNGEASITAAIELERNRRLLADDEEYKKAVEALRLQFEAKKALIDQNSLDLEQRRLNDAVAEQSFQQQLANLANQFAGKKNETNKQADEKAKASKKVADDAIKKLEADKNAALEAEKKRSDAALKALDEKKAADDKALEKQKLQTQYDAEVQEFNQTKAVKTAQIVASGIAGAAGAFAATAGSLPFGLGIPIGLAIAGTILAATYASASQVNSQQPVKPAALIAESGGKITGGEFHTGASGGVDIKAERGETILSRELTNKLEASLAGKENGGGQNIYFQDGAIRLLELNSDIVSAMARAVGDEIRRGGLALA
jgi:hypothetical protein